MSPGRGVVTAGARVYAPSPDGVKIPFEIGTGLADATAYPVSDLWNFNIAPYWFDDSEQCWPQGATELWVQNVGFGFTDGQALLIQTDLPGESLRQMVHLISGRRAVGFETTDPLFGNIPVTRHSSGAPRRRWTAPST